MCNHKIVSLQLGFMERENSFKPPWTVINISGAEPGCLNHRVSSRVREEIHSAIRIMRSDVLRKIGGDCMLKAQSMAEGRRDENPPFS